MMFEWKKLSLLYISLALVSTAAGLYGYMYIRVANLHTGLSGLREERAQLQANLDMARTVKSTLAQTDQHYQELLEHVVVRDNPTAFFARIEEVNAVSSVTVDVTNPAERAGAVEGTRELTATIDLLGTWVGVTRALEMLETLPYIGAIDRVSLDQQMGDEGVSWRGVVNVRMLLQ